MSDRKYRQRGYQDEGRERSEKPKRAPEDRPPREMRAPNFPGFVQAMRCARCGRPYTGEGDATATCAGCGVALHSCIQCSAFDPGSRYECMQTIPARVAPKDGPNTCALFEPRVRVERQTGSVAPASARSAFDDLFKF
jgi:hypothetical protein